jgi:pimeloyl-ACP methyl ester carboxylesterase
MNLCSSTSLKPIARWAAVAIAVVAATVSSSSWAADRVERAGELTLTVRGEGKPVLMIPGLNSAASVWDEACAALQPGVKCLMVQIPGFAGAPHSEAFRQSVVARSSELLNAYLKQNHPQGATVAGHSLGGVIAMNMGLQEGSPVKRLLIVDSLAYMAAAMNPSITVKQALPQAEATRQAMANSPLSKEALTAQLRPMVATMALSKPHQERALEWGLSSDPATTGQAMYDMAALDLRQELSRLQVPTIVLGAWAAYKPFGATLESTRKLFEGQYQKLKNVDIRMSQGGYHFLMWDDAPLVTQALRDSL